MSGEILSGAAQGAAAGSVGGPVGAVVGAVLGAITGIFSSKANSAKRAAMKEQRIMAERQAGIQRRDLFRSMLAARANALAQGSSQEGGLQSTAVLGALSSIDSQGKANLGFFDTQVASNRRVNSLLNKATNYENNANLVGSVVNLGASFASSDLFGKKPKAEGTDSFSTGYINSTGSFQAQFDKALINGWDPTVPAPMLGH